MSTPISKTKYTEQYIQNMSFDDDYKISAVELMVENAAGTALVRQKETPIYDTLVADTSDESNIIITKKLSGVTVDTKNIQIL